MQENIQKTIVQKLATLPPDHKLITPDQIKATVQADWLISLLQKMYVNHGITSQRNKLVSDIESGNCRCWFVAGTKGPVASAALVKQSDGSVELGRAVTFLRGAGSVTMLSAALDHLQHSTSPLVAEVRVSADFEGVESGLATQKICLGLLNLNPHALMPAFRHGTPTRQEQFLFSSSGEIQNSEPAFIPDDIKSREHIEDKALALAKIKFAKRLDSKTHATDTKIPTWKVIKDAPFSIMVKTQDGVPIQPATRDSETHAPFTLVPLSASPENVSAMVACLNSGFVACGIDRNLDSQGFPIILFGRLASNTLLAPIALNSVVLNVDQTNIIQKIDSNFRNRKISFTILDRSISFSNLQPKRKDSNAEL